MYRLSPILVFAACGRVGFDEQPTPAADAAFDPALVLWLDMEHPAPGPVVGGVAACPDECPLSTAGRHGQGFAFGLTRWLTVEVTVPLPDRDFTWSAWARPGTVAGFNAVLSMDAELELDVENAAALGWIDGTPLVAGGAITSGAWQHLALTRSGDQVVLYVDAGEVARGTSGDPLAFVACPLLIGIDRDGPGCTDALDGGWDGELDEVRIYARALTAGELARDRVSPTPLSR